LNAKGADDVVASKIDQIYHVVKRNVHTINLIGVVWKLNPNLYNDSKIEAELSGDRTNSEEFVKTFIPKKLSK